MQIISTAAEMAACLISASDPEIRSLLQEHAERLAEYEGFALSELATFAIIASGDQVEALEHILNSPLLTDSGSFALTLELIARHTGWYEATFILSDDGFALVLFIAIECGIDPKLLAACEDAMSACSDID